MSHKQVIAVVGPTSSGKTSLGIFLAKKLKGEVISADSRQVYKGLNIGTGKVTKKEMLGIPHHLLDVASPKKVFTADDFVKRASKVVRRINLPIVVGGTGFYVDALLGRITLSNVPPNPTLRAKLEKKNVEALFALLKKKDPARAQTIEPHHKRRLIRALEIAEGRQHTSLALSSLASPQYDVLWLGLNPAPKRLAANIHKRLLARIKQGMVAEAKRLHKGGLSYKRMEALGLEYRCLARLLQNKITQQEFVAELEREINRYARRQQRWFVRNSDIIWVTSNTDALRHARQFLTRKSI